jgi:hypothetical protein
MRMKDGLMRVNAADHDEVRRRRQDEAYLPELLRLMRGFGRRTCPPESAPNPDLGKLETA